MKIKFMVAATLMAALVTPNLSAYWIRDRRKRISCDILFIVKFLSVLILCVVTKR